MLTNILEQIRNRAYAPNPWDEVLGNPAFAEWPLKEYGQRLKAYRESLQNIKQPETSWGQRAWQALGRLFPQGRDAEVPEWRGIKKEEDKKIEQKAKQPAGNSFPPTPFDWRNYTNSETAHTNDKITNMPSPAEQRNLSEVHKSVQEIEKKFGVHIKINSAFRNEELNNTVGGVSNSSHRIGYAADIEIEKEKHADVMRWLRDHMTDESRKDRCLLTINQAISYPGSNFIHIDINPAGGARKNPVRQFMVEVNKTKYMYKFK